MERAVLTGKGRGRKFSEDEDPGQMPEGWDVIKTSSASSYLYLVIEHLSGSDPVSGTELVTGDMKKTKSIHSPCGAHMQE